ncbi:hypothetical protein CMV_008474 [Castanea mollissima]|uniref:Uncharacterized protein n=1 Tax=Castanea mollissima TaxID=60419 RepID=A0A8J4RRM4_9ROSI|nr:hypothetical protein CMV_008474 [Castanea mollissima]
MEEGVTSTLTTHRPAANPDAGSNMNETTEIPEGQDLEAGQGTTNVQKDKGKPPLPPNAELVNDAATSELGMSTPTPIDVDG